MIAPGSGRVFLFTVVVSWHVWSRWSAASSSWRRSGLADPEGHEQAAVHGGRVVGAGRGACGSSFGWALGRQLPCPLAQVVQVAAKLVQGEADAEQAPDLVG